MTKRIGGCRLGTGSGNYSSDPTGWFDISTCFRLLLSGLAQIPRHGRLRGYTAAVPRHRCLCCLLTTSGETSEHRYSFIATRCHISAHGLYRHGNWLACNWFFACFGWVAAGLTGDSGYTPSEVDLQGLGRTTVHTQHTILRSHAVQLELAQMPVQHPRRHETPHASYRTPFHIL